MHSARRAAALECATEANAVAAGHAAVVAAAVGHAVVAAVVGRVVAEAVQNAAVAEVVPVLVGFVYRYVGPAVHRHEQQLQEAKTKRKY